VSECRIFLKVDPNVECKEPRIRDRLPARRRRRDIRIKAFSNPQPEYLLCREGFALQKSTSVEQTFCSNTNGSAMSGTAAILRLFGSRADAAFVKSHRRSTVMVLMSAPGVR
jgi:hypothetical protein